MLHLIIALQIAAAGAPTENSAALLRLQRDAGDFLWVWRFYWEASETIRHETRGRVFPRMGEPRAELAGDTVRYRQNLLHCHPDANAKFTPPAHIIAEGDGSRRAICPDWVLGDSALPDERLSIDNAIVESLRPGVRRARAELIEALERGASELPTNQWIVGERVRFAIDQQDSAAAWRAIDDCHAASWWCLALRGYVRYASGATAVADSLFERSLAAMTLEDRCAWADLWPVLDPAARKAYDAIPCAQRDSVNARIWWLADPVYSERGNQRRAEHFARTVMISLRSGVRPSERWNWIDGHGGRSTREMVLRYGWPTQVWWAGPLEDRSHYGYLGIDDDSIQALGTFTTAEYSQHRYHTVPKWSAVVNPWQAPPTAWDIVAPRGKKRAPDEQWWPQEHYARSEGALVPITEAQVGMLRRRNGHELALATDLSHVDLERHGTSQGTAWLVVTSSPDSLRLASQQVSLDSTLVWRSSNPTAAAIIGVEVHAGAGTSVARMRFGIQPPPPLSAMRPGEIDISVPVLVRPAARDELPNSDPPRALATMLGSTKLSGVQRVGVYWETYGIAAGDSVDVAVRIDRRGTAGLLRRLGTALHMADRVDGSVTVRWHEPQPGVVTTTVADVVPIQGRNVSIDLSRLVPDKYTVTVIVTRGTKTLSASRDFELARP